MNWQDYLEIVGAQLFLRYRKRLMSPGITWEILRDYPKASLIDVAVRVHAARQILREGQDFQALSAIRSGEWAGGVSKETQEGQPRRRTDPISRALVSLGGVLFAVFFLSSLLVADGWALVLGSGVLLLLLGWRSVGTGPSTGAVRAERESMDGRGALPGL